MSNEFFYIYEIDEDNNWSVCTWDEKSDCYDPQVTIASDDTIGMEELEDFLNKLWEEQDNWINIKNQLPEKNDTVLVIGRRASEEKPYIEMVLFQGEGFVIGDEYLIVSHWQPLPKMPSVQQICSHKRPIGSYWIYCPYCGKELGDQDDLS